MVFLCFDRDTCHLRSASLHQQRYTLCENVDCDISEPHSHSRNSLTAKSVLALSKHSTLVRKICVNIGYLLCTTSRPSNTLLLSIAKKSRSNRSNFISTLIFETSGIPLRCLQEYKEIHIRRK